MFLGSDLKLDTRILKLGILIPFMDYVYQASNPFLFFGTSLRINTNCPEKFQAILDSAFARIFHAPSFRALIEIPTRRPSAPKAFLLRLTYNHTTEPGMHLGAPLLELYALKRL